MRVSDFDYSLPERLIAQSPARRRDDSRLMILDRAGTGLRHARFRDLPAFLRAGDLLILNDTRVVPARLTARKSTGGRIEALLLEPEETDAGEAGGRPRREVWRALVRGFGRGKGRRRFTFPGGLELEVLGRQGPTEAGEPVVRVALKAPGDTTRALEEAGRPPTPPYIRRDPEDERISEDRERYQTVYARFPGAVAAPTAGLHFTQDLLRSLEGRGIRVASLTLHVGWGTFKPVRVDRVEHHQVDPERYRIPEGLPAAVAETRSRAGRIVAVGTTVARALEYAARDGEVRAGSGRCDMMILPGHRFRAVDALVTNFHLPRSSLLFLVCAFAGRERILEAYGEAIRREYRFYSYGDAMLIL